MLTVVPSAQDATRRHLGCIGTSYADRKTVGTIVFHFLLFLFFYHPSNLKMLSGHRFKYIIVNSSYAYKDQHQNSMYITYNDQTFTHHQISMHHQHTIIKSPYIAQNIERCHKTRQDHYEYNKFTTGSTTNSLNEIFETKPVNKAHEAPAQHIVHRREHHHYKMKKNTR